VSIAIRLDLLASSGGAYDLFPSRTLKFAQLVRRPTGQAALELFVNDGLGWAVHGHRDTKPAMRLGELNQRLPYACSRLG
jgi:hypothetical protein